MSTEEPRYRSPQALETEELLLAMEDALTPVLAKLILDHAIADPVNTLVSADTMEPVTAGLISKTIKLGIIPAGVLIAPALISKLAVRGLKDYIAGALKTVLFPFVLQQLRSLLDNSTGRPASPADPSPVDLNEVAEEAIQETLRRAVTNLSRSSSRTADVQRDGDIYDAFNLRDVRTPAQRQAEIAANRAARWIARDVVFTSQDRVARRFGYTHKRWVTERDERVRDEHRLLEGVTVQIGAPFTTPTGTIEFPGDVSAPIHLWVNCRCSLEFLSRTETHEN